MQSIWITRYGGPEVLELRESQDPQPKERQVRIRVHASGVNFSDLLARSGLYPAAPKPPCVVGYEVAGNIDAVGTAARGFSLGDRVVAMTPFGGHAELVCVDASCVVALPNNVSFEAAAALPVNYLTANRVVNRAAVVQPGETVLVHMAAGGVGLAVLDLCRHIPNVTVIGTASAAKHHILYRRGASYAIDYRRQDYVEAVQEITNGRGVDVVFDPLGGRDWKRGYGLLRPGGRLIAYGFANLHAGSGRKLWRIIPQLLATPRFSPLKLMRDGRTVAGISLAPIWGAPLREELQALVARCERGEIDPTIDSSFDFARSRDAQARLEQRRNTGKVLLTVR